MTTYIQKTNETDSTHDVNTIQDDIHNVFFGHAILQVIFVDCR